MSRDGSGDQYGDAARLFDGSRLTLARHLAGYRKNGLAEAIGKTPTAIAAYESGTKRPAPATVAQLSLALGVSPDFFLPGPGGVEAMSVPHFRSLRSTTQIARDRAGAFGRVALGIATIQERHVELPNVDLPRYPVALDGDAEGEPEKAARLLRQEWNISSGPFGHAVRAAENHGVLVVFGPQEGSSVDAYSFEGPLRPVVVLNPLKDDYFRQRFDVAHELGHLVMHLDAEPGLKTVEDQAHRFAAELLMPAEELRDVLPSKANWRRLALLKEKWGVSMQSLLFRGRRLGVMSETTYRNAMTTVSARGWRRQEPGPSTSVEQPSLLPRAVELLRDHGVDAASLATEARVPLPLFELATARVPVGWQLKRSEPQPRQRPSARLSLLPDMAR